MSQVVDFLQSVVLLYLAVCVYQHARISRRILSILAEVAK